MKMKKKKKVWLLETLAEPADGDQKGGRLHHFLPPK